MFPGPGVSGLHMVTMDIIDQASTATAWALLPPIVAVSLAIVTRRVLWSLSLGIVAGVLIATSGRWPEGLRYFVRKLYAVVTDTDRLLLVVFLLILGLVMSYLSCAGSALAFGTWARRRIRSRTQAKLITMALSVAIFIDDYFHALTAGSIARPMTDRFRISRAKLAFLLDSTAAPVCILVPLSSWGAYIIGLIGEIRPESSPMSGLELYLASIPLNFYALVMLLLVVGTVVCRLDIGPMSRFEQQVQQGEDVSASSPVQDDVDVGYAQSEGGLSRLVWSLLGLVFTTVGMIFLSGWWFADRPDTFSLLSLLEYAQVPLALLSGGVVGVAVSIWGVPRSRVWFASLSGVKSMMPAVVILLFAWILASIIKDLETGTYLAQFVGKYQIEVRWLPLVVFWISGFIAFSTGTSWGTFGIMLPLVAGMVHVLPEAPLVAMFGAALAGSVFGDHCSPISDTTILSSTGAQCRLMDHVVSQLPYTLIAAAIASIGYLIWGFGGSVWMTWGCMLVMLVLTFWLVWLWERKMERSCPSQLP